MNKSNMSEINITHTGVKPNMAQNTELVLVGQSNTNNVGIDPSTDMDQVQQLENLGQDLGINRSEIVRIVEVAFQDEDSHEREILTQLSQRVQEDNQHFAGQRGLALAKGSLTIPDGVTLHEANTVENY